MSDHSSPKHYVKIWGILLVLFVISICGPELEIRWLTMLTAFGIAFVKAGVVIKYFMHLPQEKKYVTWILVSMLLMTAMFYLGVVVDVQNDSGSNWVRDAVAAPVSAEADAHTPGDGDDH
jgi:caa(3)-type oxidase subunit IV